MLDEVQLISSPVKVLHFTVSMMKFPNGAAPCTPESQTMDF